MSNIAATTTHYRNNDRKKKQQQRFAANRGHRGWIESLQASSPPSAALPFPPLGCRNRASFRGFPS